MHSVYLLSGLCLILTAAAIFVLRFLRKRRDAAADRMQDEKIRLTIIQTEAHLAQEQTRKFEAAMKKPQKQKKRKKQTR